MQATDIAHLFLRVDKALDTIRPYMISDGGNIKLLEITPALVARVALQGECGNCPMSTMTMRAGVEESIRQAVPEIVSVEAVSESELQTA